MLTQTDRFGTSIAQALRTHAATSRTKRRQRAEERASKVGVKLVFPLALCLVPALYVVCLGPIIVRIMRTLLLDAGPFLRRTDVDNMTITLLVVFAVLVVAVHDAAAEPSAQPGLALSLGPSQGTDNDPLAPRGSRRALSLRAHAACRGVRRRARARNVSRRPAASGTAPTVEARDPALAAALARLAFFPSAEAHEAVAREYRRLGLLEQAFDARPAALAPRPA